MNYEFSEIDLRRLDLNQLLVFSAIMREGGVVKAANRLHIGPSAVSMALARLRDSLGDPLFVRAGAGIEPTPRAEALWERIGPSLAEIEAATLRAARFDPSTAETVFRVALPDDLEFVLLPRLMTALAERAPGVRIIARPADFRTLLDRLDAGDADMALSAKPPGGVEARHRVRDIRSEGFKLLFDADRFDGATVLSLETYLASDHILLSTLGDLTGAIDMDLRELGLARRVVLSVAHFPTIPFVLKARRAVAHFPETAAAHFARAYGLALADPPIETRRFDLALHWHARLDADPANQWLRALVVEVLEGLIADGA